MKSSKNLGTETPSFQWVSKKKSATLKQGDKNLLSIEFGKKGKSKFEIDNTTYKIRNKGFWNPKTVIETKGATIVTLDRNVAGNKASIHFANGKVYECHIQTKPTTSLVFNKPKGKAIITQQLNSEGKKIIPLKLDQQQVPQSDLLYLLALGQYSSHELAKEKGKNGQAKKVVAKAKKAAAKPKKAVKTKKAVAKTKSLSVKSKAAAYRKPKTAARRKAH